MQKAYTVISNQTNKIFEDGVDNAKGQMVKVMPMFYTKKDCIAYAKETWGTNPKYPEFKSRYQDYVKVIKVSITKY